MIQRCDLPQASFQTLLILRICTTLALLRRREFRGLLFPWILNGKIAAGVDIKYVPGRYQISDSAY